MHKPAIASLLATVAAAAAIGMAPAIARQAGPGGGNPAGSAATGGPPAAPPHFANMNPSGLCVLDACRGGNAGMNGGSRAGRTPGLAYSHPSPVVTRRLASENRKGIASSYMHRPCTEPMCHDHHHHRHHQHFFEDDFALFGDSGPYYEPQTDCWRWSHRLHRRVWVCKPYPNG